MKFLHVEARQSSQILINQVDQYCSHKNVTTAMLHIKQWTVTIENSTGSTPSDLLSDVVHLIQGSYYFAEFIFPDFSRQNE